MQSNTKVIKTKGEHILDAQENKFKIKIKTTLFIS